MLYSRESCRIFDENLKRWVESHTQAQAAANELRQQQEIDALSQRVTEMDRVDRERWAEMDRATDRAAANFEELKRRRLREVQPTIRRLSLVVVLACVVEKKACLPQPR